MSNEFTWGFILGCGVFSALWILGDKSYRKILEMKANPANRTPEKIGDHFYYIVPESEYVKMERYMAWYQNAGEDQP